MWIFIQNMISLYPPGGGNSNPLQYCCLKNSMDRGAWQATVQKHCKELDTSEQLNTHTHTHTYTQRYFLNVFLTNIGESSSSFFLKKLYLFLAVLCRLLFSFSEQGLLFCLRCSDFSCCRAQALRHVGFSSCGSKVLEHRLSSCGMQAWLFLSM